jgi:hypothetical protein
MSSESEPGDNFERGGRIGCDASPILQLGEHAIDDVSALLGGVITRVWRAPAPSRPYPPVEQSRQLITRLFVDPAYQPAQVCRQQLRVAKMILRGSCPRTLPIDVDAVGDMLSPKRLEGEEKLAIMFSVLEHMVGGENGDDGLRVARSRPGGRGADGGGAVAPVRLEQDLGLGADLPQLLSDPKTIFVIGYDDCRVEYSRVAHHADNGLKSRALPDQGDELLRQALPRFGPHAGAGPAAHDHRQDLYTAHFRPSLSCSRFQFLMFHALWPRPGGCLPIQQSHSATALSERGAL